MRLSLSRSQPPACLAPQPQATATPPAGHRPPAARKAKPQKPSVPTVSRPASQCECVRRPCRVPSSGPGPAAVVRSCRPGPGPAAVQRPRSGVPARLRTCVAVFSTRQPPPLASRSADAACAPPGCLRPCVTPSPPLQSGRFSNHPWRL
jgi:hypothetical protein